MRKIFGTALLMGLGALPLGCKKDEQPAPQQPINTAYPPPTAQPTQPTQPAPAPTVPAPAPTTAATLSTPSPMALPCTADANCLTHRCNTAAGKCAWPCQADTDCNPGNRCMGGACIPSAQ
jgi:hypothetical protein